MEVEPKLCVTLPNFVEDETIENIVK